MDSCQQEVGRIEKLLVYRGYDNIESLIDFYRQLQQFAEKVERSEFAPQVISQVIA